MNYQRFRERSAALPSGAPGSHHTWSELAVRAISVPQLRDSAEAPSGWQASSPPKCADCRLSGWTRTDQHGLGAHRAGSRRTQRRVRSAVGARVLSSTRPCQAHDASGDIPSVRSGATGGAADDRNPAKSESAAASPADSAGAVLALRAGASARDDEVRGRPERLAICETGHRGCRKPGAANGLRSSAAWPAGPVMVV